MAMKDYVLKRLRIEHKGIFDMKDFYKTLFMWFEHHEYKWKETAYSETDLGENTKAVGIVWEVNKKVDDYIKFIMELEFSLKMTPIEVEENGLKSQSHKGKFELKISAYLLKDYEDKWDKKPIGKFIREAYDKYVISSRLTELEGDLFNEVQELLKDIKKYLRMQTG